MKKVLFLTFLFISVHLVKSQEMLRYDLHIGDTFIILQEASQEIKQLLPGQEQVINNNLTGLLYFNVVDTNPKFYTIELSFKQFKIRMSSPTLGKMMNIDTNKVSEGIEYQMFKGMLDRPMKLLMTPTGEITEILDGDTIITGMLQGMGDLDEATKSLVRTHLKKDWSAETLSRNFEQMTFIYPTEFKKSGDTWTNSYAGEGKINAENTWTYQSADDTIRNLTADATITVSLNTTAVTMKLSGSQSTKATVFKENGFIQKIAVSSTASGDSVMPHAPDITIPTTINSITTYTLQ